MLDRDGRIESALITTFSSDYNVFNLNSEQSKEFLDKSYKDSKKIDDYLNSMYSSLPEEFKIKTYFNSDFSFSDGEKKLFLIKQHYTLIGLYKKRID